jgi:hypothetical protein
MYQQQMSLMNCWTQTSIPEIPTGNPYPKTT